MRVCQIHKCQYASNLLRRVARFQVVDDLIPQGRSWPQAARHARGDRTGMGARMGRVGTVAACHRRAPRATTRLRSRPAVSTEFARQRRSRTMQPHGNRCWLEAHLQLCVDHRPFLKAQLRIEVSHAPFSPKNLHLVFERAQSLPSLISRNSFCNTEEHWWFGSFWNLPKKEGQLRLSYRFCELDKDNEREFTEELLREVKQIELVTILLRFVRPDRYGILSLLLNEC